MTELNLLAAIADLDNTVLHGSTISEKNVEAACKLRQRRAKFIIATGRNFHGMKMYHRRLELDTPAVSSDGGLVSVPGGKIISERHIPQDACARIIEEAASRGVSCLSYFLYGVRVSSKFDWHENMQRHFDDMGSFCRYVKPQSMIKKPVYKTLLFALDSKRLDDFESLILGSYGNEVDKIRNGPNTLEFVQKGVSKVSGLNVVAQECGFEPSQAVAFGDGINDVGMFRWAGLSVCMNHGHELAKKAATLVAPPTEADVNFAAAVDMVLAGACSKTSS
jgi:Cof subfamily protein (haloacid dehalogenase superfamily)